MTANRLGLTSKFFMESTQEKWDAVRAAGFETAELVFPTGLPEKEMVEEAARRREHILGAGLDILSAHTPFGKETDPSSTDPDVRGKTMDLERRILDRIAQWGIPIAVMHASYEPIREDEREERLRIARDSVADLGAHAKAGGVTLAVEELPRTCLGNCSDEILFLTGHGKLAGITFDFNHLLRESHEAFLEATAPFLVSTHVSDYDFVDEKHWMPGVGKVEWKKVICALCENGYTGQFLFETYEHRAIPGKLCTPEMILESWHSLMQSDGPEAAAEELAAWAASPVIEP